MNLKSPKCTSCGSPLTIIDENKAFVTCSYCNATVVVENANSLKNVEVDRSRELENLWFRLAESKEANSIQNISRYASQILQIVSNDYRAKYYFAYSEDVLNQHKYLSNFYKTKPKFCSKDEIEEIIDHISRFSRLRDYTMIINYINKLEVFNANKYKEIYLKAFEERKENEEHYDSIPRDVFICHRSTNVDVAKSVVSELEKDGNKCWISSRNLKENDSENYWINIEQAINDCKVFLVISSMDAMLSDDVKKEIQIAKRLNKPRIQLKIDNANPTTFFKDFFDGIPWINAMDNSEESYITLKDRAYQLIHDLVHDKKRKTIEETYKEEFRSKKSTDDKKEETFLEMPISMNPKLDNILKKVSIDIENGVFEDAKKDLDKAIYLDAMNGKIWWFKLLVEFKSQDETELVEHEEAMNSRNFINALKYGNDSIKSKLESLEKAFKDKKAEMERLEEEFKLKREENKQKEKERQELEKKRAEEQERLEEKKERRQNFKIVDTKKKDYEESLKVLKDQYQRKNDAVLEKIKIFDKNRSGFEPFLKSKVTSLILLFIYILVHTFLFSIYDINEFLEVALWLNFGGLLLWPVILAL